MIQALLHGKLHAAWKVRALRQGSG